MSLPGDDEPTLSHPAVDPAELEEAREIRVLPLDVRGRIVPVRLGPLEVDRLRALDEHAAELEARAAGIAHLEAQARARGCQAGFEEGVREGTRRFLDTLSAFEKRLSELECRIPDAIAALSARLAARCLGREIASNDESLRHWVRTHAASLMPAVVVTCLHAPADGGRLAFLREEFAREFPHTRFEWHPAPGLSAGELLLESENLRVDARFDAMEGWLRRALEGPDGKRDGPCP